MDMRPYGIVVAELLNRTMPLFYTFGNGRNFTTVGLQMTREERWSGISLAKEELWDLGLA
jgi:hypothetical protein